MSEFKLLLVEDNKEEIAVCKETIARYNDEKKREVELVESRSVDDAFDKLDSSFDGAIIDLKLAGEGGEGNRVIQRISESNLRIPVAILTGTPDAVDSDFVYFGVFTKGEAGAGYDSLLDRFWEIHDTGLTRIMGGRGVIEKTLNEVFRKNLLPHRAKWITYGARDSERTEKALLRHTISHLQQLLEEDEELCFPEEVYLTPPISESIRTGSLVRKMEDGKKHVVMNPACDLLIRKKGKIKTERILIVEIDSQEQLFPPASTGLSSEQKNNLKKAYENNFTLYFHWLPKTDSFEGGFMNFRKLASLPQEEFEVKYEKPMVQISPAFVKDIVARFSAYYARQGQPDIDADCL